MYGDIALDALLQGDERLGSHHARDVLQTSVQQVHELLVIAGIELHHHGVWTSSEVTLYDFGDMAQALYHVLVHGTTLQRDTYIGTGGIAQTLGVYVETATHDDPILNEVLYTLMDGGT